MEGKRPLVEAAVRKWACRSHGSSSWKARDQFLHFALPNHAAFHDGARSGLMLKVLRAETFCDFGDAATILVRFPALDLG